MSVLAQLSSEAPQLSLPLLSTLPSIVAQSIEHSVRSSRYHFTTNDCTASRNTYRSVCGQLWIVFPVPCRSVCQPVRRTRKIVVQNPSVDPPMLCLPIC